MLTEPQLEVDDELLSISESSFLQDEKIVNTKKIELF